MGGSVPVATGSRRFDRVRSMTFVTIELDGHVATVTLSRPEALNAISGEVANELAGALLQAAADPEAWVVVLGAAGDRAVCVCAGLEGRQRPAGSRWVRKRGLMPSSVASA